MKNHIILLALLIISSCKSQNKEVVTILDLESFKTAVIGNDVQLVDVRTPNEYKAGHIDDAVNIGISDMDAFIAKFNKLDKSKPLYVYCMMGGRSHMASVKLQELGFQEIYDFKGGYKAWSGQ